MTSRSRKTDEQLADEMIAMMQKAGISTSGMLEVIRMAREKYERRRSKRLSLLDNHEV